MNPDFRKSTVLYGGSFDPIHLAHLHVAQEVLQIPEIEQILFVPSQQSPGKNAPVANAQERWEFLQIALGNTPYQAWDIELHRPGASFTVDTLREAHRLGATKEKLYWLLGADAYAYFSSWREPEEIRRLARLIVVARPEYTLQSQNPEDLLLKIPTHDASSTSIREAFLRGEFPVSSLPKALGEHFQNLALQRKNPYAIHEELWKQKT